MRGFSISNNPYVSGVRPKPFFSSLSDLIKREKMLGKANKKANPKLESLITAYDKKAA